MIFFHGLMVYFVRPANFQKVFIIGFEGLETVVYKPIVEYKIDSTIQADPCSHPETVIECDMPQPH